MKMKKWIAGALTALLILGLGACGEKDTAVYVQSVAQITGVGAVAMENRFPGMVVSENVTEIKKDADKTVAELKVKEGDDVKAGQELFTYDAEEIQLTLDKQKLELEQLQTQIESYKNQIATLEKEKKNAGSDSQAQYTVEIQTAQLNLKEAELSLKSKNAEVEQTQKLLDNVNVVSPVNGRIQSIKENGTDSNGNPAAYITIQQEGSFRIKGTLGELQRGSITEGTRVRIYSRTDNTEFWTGTISKVDYENATQGTDSDRYYGMSSDPMTSSSKYPFYVELDTTTGLIMGQHVYMEVDGGTSAATGLQLPSYFVCMDDNENPFVWAENAKGQLEKRSLTLGTLDEMRGTYEVLDGLTSEDYIAYPDETLCKEGAPTTHEYVEPTDDENGENGGTNNGGNGSVDGENGMIDNGMIDNGGIIDGGAVEGENGGAGGMDQANGGISSDEPAPSESVEG